MLLAAVIALAWANSPWQQTYLQLWHTPLSVGVGPFALSRTLHEVINEALMAVFFFVVGLEIKREVLVGELASPRRAALPIVAAVGGMIVPAVCYALMTAGTAGAHGWGIPMATDIAFALGIMSLLGKRVPLALKVFLVALAIVDDLGAVLVIALVYTSDLSPAHLLAAAGWLGVLLGLNRSGVRSSGAYLAGAVGLWFAIFHSGVHATVAGVLAAFTIPSRARIDTDRFLAEHRTLLAEFERAGHSSEEEFMSEGHQMALQAMGRAAIAVQTPMERLEHRLHPLMALLVMPLFALANAGLVLDPNSFATLTHPVTLGVMVGLVAGKQAGVMGAVWMAVKLNMAALPPAVSWRQLYAASWLAGVGFTMSLFIADLALADPALLGCAKLGILSASFVAGSVGWWLLRRAAKRP